MLTLKSKIIILALIVFAFVIGIYLYPQMPAMFASHWNAHGQVDGYMSKFWGLFLMPLTSIGLFLLFIFIPRLDPLRQNIEEFRQYYSWFAVLVITFLLYLWLLTIFWNLGFRFDIGRFLSPALGVLFYYIGVLLGQAKQNWFIGIRTPWTLSSEKVWTKTHKIGAKLFKASGSICLLAIFLPQYALFFILGPIILASLYLIVYSYFAY